LSRIVARHREGQTATRRYQDAASASLQFETFELFGHFVDNRLLIGINPHRYSDNFTCAIFSFT
jgi:hypothetical protein